MSARLSILVITPLLGCGAAVANPDGRSDGTESGMLETGSDTDAASGTVSNTDAASGTDTNTDTDTDGGTDPGPYIGRSGNNWSCLRDGDYPAGVTDDPSLRKVIPYTVDGGSPSLSLGDMTLSRTRASSGFLRTHIPVTNLSASTWCFIRLEELAFSNGAVELSNDGTSFVQGSVAELGGGLATDTCLVPGESGYFFAITEVDFDQVTEASFTLEDPDTPGVSSASGVVPSEYAVSGSDAEITVEHIAGDPVTASSPSVFLLRDLQGEPVYWGFADADTPLDLSLGEVQIYTASESSLEQSGTEICFWVDYEPLALRSELELIAPCPADVGGEGCEEFRWAARNARVAEQQAQG